MEEHNHGRVCQDSTPGLDHGAMGHGGMGAWSMMTTRFHSQG